MPNKRLLIIFPFTLLFLGSCHAIVFSLASFKTIYPILPVYGVLGVFWICFTLAALLSFTYLSTKSKSSHLETLLDQLSTNRTVNWLLYISLVGLVFHIYSKYSLTEIRPVTCLFDIRYAWLEVPHALQPISVRISSILGHLLTVFALPSIVISGWALSSRQKVSVSRLWLFTIFVLSLLIGFVYAGFLGSRNAMLAFVIISIFSVFLGISTSSTISVKNIFQALLLLIIPILLGLTFTNAVFSDRMFCGNETIESPTNNQIKSSKPKISSNYVKGFEDEIPVKSTKLESGTGTLKAWISNNCPICNPTFLYINHGLLNLSQVIATKNRGQPVLASKVLWIFNRLGLIKKSVIKISAKRNYGRGGLPLAGSAYHDYGWGGVIVIGLVFGLIVGTAVRGLSASVLGAGISIAVLVCCFYILVLSYIFTATAVMFFPFIAFSSLVTFFLIPMISNFSYMRLDFVK